MVPDLFPELIVEILNRVPVRDRARFRCICKSWSHLSIKRIPIFLICAQDDTSSVRFCSYDMYGNLLKQFDKNFTHCMDIVSTCLDFVCSVNPTSGTLCLCNPTIEELITVPLGDNHFGIFGTDYVASTKEFKVLRIRGHKSTCEVFTVGTNYGWRAVQSPPFAVWCYQHGAFANGSIHFLPDVYHIDGDIHEIAFFNVEREEWGRVTFPPINSCAYTTVLRELTGCLCVVVLDENDGECSMNIWLLKNLGWVKGYCFNLPPALDMVNVSFFSNCLGPLLEDDDGSLLLVLAPEPDPTGSIYRVKCDSNKVLDFQVLARGRYLSAGLYLESYLSFERIHASS